MVLLKKVCLYISMLAFFALVGVAASPLKKAAEANGRAFSRQSIEAALGGKSSLWGLLGGYRSLISDFAWIKGYIDWERKDISGCISSIELATAIDPYMTIFWTQGAAMIAFDMPHWLLQKLPPTQRDEKALRTFKIRQSAIALKFLDKGLSLFPGNGELLLQKGQIAISIGDYKLAEECYAPLAASSDPTVYSRRIYASLLTKNGKFQKAAEILKSVLDECEDDSPIKKLLEEQIARTKEMLKKTRD